MRFLRVKIGVTRSFLGFFPAAKLRVTEETLSEEWRSVAGMRRGGGGGGKGVDIPRLLLRFMVRAGYLLPYIFTTCSFSQNSPSAGLNIHCTVQVMYASVLKYYVPRCVLKL